MDANIDLSNIGDNPEQEPAIFRPIEPSSREWGYWHRDITPYVQNSNPVELPESYPEEILDLANIFDRSQLDHIYRINPYLTTPEYWFKQGDPSIFISTQTSEGRINGSGFICEKEGRLGLCIINHVLAETTNDLGRNFMITAYVRNVGLISFPVSPDTPIESLPGIGNTPDFAGMQDFVRWVQVNEDIATLIRDSTDVHSYPLGFNEELIQALQREPLQVKVQTPYGEISASVTLQEYDNGDVEIVLIAGSEENPLLCRGMSGSDILIEHDGQAYIIGGLSGIFGGDEDENCSMYGVISSIDGMTLYGAVSVDTLAKDNRVVLRSGISD